MLGGPGGAQVSRVKLLAKTASSSYVATPVSTTPITVQTPPDVRYSTARTLPYSESRVEGRSAVSMASRRESRDPSVTLPASLVKTLFESSKKHQTAAAAPPVYFTPPPAPMMTLPLQYAAEAALTNPVQYRSNPWVYDAGYALPSSNSYAVPSQHYAREQPTLRRLPLAPYAADFDNGVTWV